MDAELFTIKAKILMIDHELIQQGWTVKLRNRKLPAQCDPNKKVISFSQFYIENNNWEPHLKNSVLHEICHVLAPPIYIGGRRWRVHHAGWKRAFINIGGNGERCCSSNAILKESPPRTRVVKYTATCSCGFVHKAYKNSKNLQKYICKNCRDRLVFSPVSVTI